MIDDTEEAGKELSDQMHSLIYRTLLANGVIVGGEIVGLFESAEAEELAMMFVDKNSDEETRVVKAGALLGTACAEILGVVQRLSEVTGTGYMVLLRALAAQ